jgi:hypothetical protein
MRNFDIVLSAIEPPFSILRPPFGSLVNPAPFFADFPAVSQSQEENMAERIERRREKRLRYHWPVWFAEDFNSILAQGQMVDVCSAGASFTCYAQECPLEGQVITARFSVPQYRSDESFDLSNFIRSGHVCRVEELNPYLRRVAMTFAQPLPFKPGEQECAELPVEAAN